MMKCSKCNHEYDDSLPACPLCGEPAPVPEAKVDPALANAPTHPEPHIDPGPDAARPPLPPPTYTHSQTTSQLPPAQQMPEGSGAAPLVLGILGLLIPMIGLVLAIIAIVMGNNQRKAMPLGTAHNALGQAGWVLGIVGLCYQAFLIIYFIVVMGTVMSLVQSAISQYAFNPSYSGYNFY